MDEKTISDNLSDLLNIGPTSAKWLNGIGVNTIDDLKDLGAVAAYHLVKMQGYNATLNLLYALHGALVGLHWNELSLETKQALQEAAAGFRFVDE